MPRLARRFPINIQFLLWKGNFVKSYGWLLAKKLPVSKVKQCAVIYFIMVMASGTEVNPVAFGYTQKIVDRLRGEIIELCPDRIGPGVPFAVRAQNGPGGNQGAHEMLVEGQMRLLAGIVPEIPEVTPIFWTVA